MVVETVERAIRKKLVPELLETLARIGERHPGDPGEAEEQLLRRAAKEGDKEAQQLLTEWGDLTVK